jgi:hypothetical protein
MPLKLTSKKKKPRKANPGFKWDAGHHRMIALGKLTSDRDVSLSAKSASASLTACSPLALTSQTSDDSSDDEERIVNILIDRRRIIGKKSGKHDVGTNR